MRVFFALAFGLVAGLSFAGWQHVSIQSKKDPLPEKQTAPKLAAKTIEQVDEAFGNKGEAITKEYKNPGAGIKLATVYWEKGKVWSVTYELEPKKELSATWWQDAMKTVGLDPAKGKLSVQDSDDELKTIESYPGLDGSITIEQSEDEQTGEKVVTVDWEDETGDAG